MWTAVVFGDDTVEAVPHHWYRNSTGTCAWPKKPNTTKRKIETRAEPNIFDFDFHKARILCTNIETLEIAKKKAKQAQDTLDLGTCDDEEDKSKEHRKYRSQKVIYSQKIQNLKVQNISQRVSKPPIFEKTHKLQSRTQIKICKEKEKNDILTINNEKQSKEDYAHLNNDNPLSSVLLSEKHDSDKDKNYTKHSSKYESGKHSSITTMNSLSGSTNTSSVQTLNVNHQGG